MEYPLKQKSSGYGRMVLSAADQSLVDVIASMSLTPEQLADLGSRPGWTHLGLSRGTERSHLFVTIGLDREKTPQSLYEQVLTLPDRVSTLSGATCCLEFHPHSHCHILMDRPAKLKVFNLIRSITRALKLPRASLVDVQSSRKASDYANRVSYLHGSKVDTSKMDRVAQDRAIRESANIPHYFLL